MILINSIWCNIIGMLSTPVSLFPRNDQCLNVWTLERLSYIWNNSVQLQSNFAPGHYRNSKSTQRWLEAVRIYMEFFFLKLEMNIRITAHFWILFRDPVVAHPERYCNTEPVLQQSCFSWPLANAVKNGTQFYDTAIKTPTKGYVNDQITLLHL